MATLSTVTEEQLSLDTHMATLPTEECHWKLAALLASSSDTRLQLDSMQLPETVSPRRLTSVVTTTLEFQALMKGSLHVALSAFRQ
jgi:hypothetical protein